MQETGVGVADEGVVYEGEGVCGALCVVCVCGVGVGEHGNEEVSVYGGVETEDAGCIFDGSDGGVQAVGDGGGCG